MTNAPPPFFKTTILGFDEKAFRQVLLSGTSVIQLFKDVQEATNAQFDMRFEEGENVRKLIIERSIMMDCILHYAWHQFQWNAGISLIAVGGYGRAELHPQSDVDILILIKENTRHRHTENIEKLLMLLWDIGLNVGHSVRTLDECSGIAEEDITVATNIMESRLLQGDESLLPALSEQTSPEKMWPNDQFFLAKIEEQHARHRKYNNIENNLEPNIKNAPGGLRDIQTIKWVAKRFFKVNTLEGLARIGLLTDKEYAILEDGETFLWRVRYGLHLLAGRPEERLLFEYQGELAKRFGFKAEANNPNKIIENFMHRYYRVVLALRELNDVLLQFLDEAILQRGQSIAVVPLNERFQLRDNYIEVTDVKVFINRPSALLEIFVLLAQNSHIKGIRAMTIRLIRESRYLIDEDFTSNPENNHLFMQLLASPYKLVTQLKRMTRYGVLGRYLPEFGRIIGQMQHDLFHIYTVDAHTLNVIRFMRTFLLQKNVDKFPIASQTIKNLPNLTLLYAAGLFHDIAKGRGGDHSILGAADVRTFCQRHGFTRREAKLAAWLVENHLVMSSVSQKQDLSDPDVIHNFALQIGDLRHLDYLYVLTVADMNATNPDIWNSWRASLMSDLYLQTKRALQRGLENPIDREEVIDETQQLAMRRLLINNNVDEQAAWELWQTTGENYFLRETSDDIAWHTEAILNHHNSEEPIILIKDHNIKNEGVVTKIFIRTKSQQNIFAATTTVLDQFNLNIQSALIYSTVSGHTIDTFYVLDQNHNTISSNIELINQLTNSLLEEFQLIDNYSDIIKRRTPRQLKYFSSPTRTNIHNDTTKEYTVLEVFSPDRPGFLAQLARIFVEYNLSLLSAKVTTLGERVEDIFFITDKNGSRLSNPDSCAQLQQSICAQLDANVVDNSFTND